MGLGAALLPPEAAEGRFATGPVLAFGFFFGSGHLRQTGKQTDKANRGQNTVIATM